MRRIMLMIALAAFAASLLAPLATAQLLTTAGPYDLEPTTGSATLTITNEIGGIGSYASARGIAIYRIDWTSHTDGVVSAVIPEIVGTISRVTFNPDGTAAPSDNYDVTLKDADAFDVLGGNGGNLDEANTASLTAFTTRCSDTPTTGSASGYEPVAVCGPLTLSIANAGNKKKGSIAIYIRRE